MKNLSLKKDKTGFFNLNEKQLIILESYIKYTAKKISVRAFNVLNVLRNYGINNLLEFICGYKDIKNVRNIGVKTEKELLKYFEEIKKYIDNNMDFKDDDEFYYNYFKISSLYHYNVALDAIGIAHCRDLFFEKQFPFFLFLNHLLLNLKILSKKELFICKYYINYFNISKYSRKEIGNQLNLSAERIRQISKRFPDNIIRKLYPFITDNNYIKNYINYQKYLNNDFIIVNSEISKSINEKEKVNFTPQFFVLFFPVLYKGNYNLLSGKLMKNYYLINTGFFSKFDFEQFYYDIQSRFRKKIKKTYKLNFELFINKFFTTDDTGLIEKIKRICEKLLVCEFNLIIDTDNNIIFNRNTIKILPEYIVEIIEQAGQPLHISQIYNILAEKYPDAKKTKSISSLRGSVLMSDEIFCISRTSTYGLKKHKNIYKNVKGGTIREIVSEFLEQYEEPKHISVITDYVNKYRNTKEYSILSNLKLDKKNRYCFFPKSHVGLTSINYVGSQQSSVGNKEEVGSWQ